MGDLNSILFQVTVMVRTKMVAKMMTLMVNNIPALLLKEAKKKSDTIKKGPKLIPKCVLDSLGQPEPESNWYLNF